MGSTIWFFIIVGVFGIRSEYMYRKFIQYCKVHYPKQADNFQRLGTFTGVKAIFQEHYIDDSEFIRLKTKAKKAYICFCCAFVLGVLSIVLIHMHSFF